MSPAQLGGTEATGSPGSAPGGPVPPRVEQELDDVARLVEQARDLVLAVPGVTGLHAGMFGEAATYLPGRRVAGIRLRDDRLEVHVVVSPDLPVRDTALAVRDAVAPLVDRPVHVTVGDVAPPRASDPEAAPLSPVNAPVQE